MQNSPQRLLAGAAQALREVVGPAVAEAYPRAQLAAAAELLDNLAQRVEWRRDDGDEIVGRARPLLEDATAAAGPTDLQRARAWLVAVPGPGEPGPVLEALAEAQTWAAAHAPDGELAGRLRAFARWDLECEVRRLRNGMFKD